MSEETHSSWINCDPHDTILKMVFVKEESENIRIEIIKKNCGLDLIPDLVSEETEHLPRHAVSDKRTSVKAYG